MSLNPITRGRAKPTSGRGETLVWYLTRLSAVLLFVLALSHFAITHFIFDPADQTADWIAQNRWSTMFWRTFDWLMLMTVLLHSALGMRTVLSDIVSGPRARMLVLSALYILSIAGNETTTKLIGTMVHQLHRNPDQKALLLANPKLARTRRRLCQRTRRHLLDFLTPVRRAAFSH